jgi:hypothetical protein
MKSLSLPTWRVMVSLALIAAGLVLLGSLPAHAGSSHLPVATEASRYTLHFLPSQTRQLCAGDTATFTLWSHWVDPTQDEEHTLAPLVLPDEGPPPLAPLTVRTIVIHAARGQVSPSEFVVLSPDEYFQFTYTAAGEGVDMITAVMIDEGAVVEKTIPVMPSCEYDISFLITASEINEYGGFAAVFQGSGDFFVNRTAQDAGVLAGSGQDDVGLLMWALAEEAFVCTMEKISARSTFEVEGMLNPEPYNFLHVNLRFAPMNMPSQMNWSCQMTGYGQMDLTVPLGDISTSGSDMDMVGLTFPLHGGVEEVSVPGSRGYVIVRPR